MNWYLKVLRNYANFEGRARRTEYWMFTLFNIIFAIIALMIDYNIGDATTIFGINLLYSIAMLLPGLAVAVRRLHDIGKSGWMLFILFIPIIGSIWLIVLLATEGTPGENEYGTNPKEEIE